MPELTLIPKAYPATPPDGICDALTVAPDIPCFVYVNSVMLAWRLLTNILTVLVLEKDARHRPLLSAGMKNDDGEMSSVAEDAPGVPAGVSVTVFAASVILAAPVPFSRMIVILSLAFATSAGTVMTACPLL